MIPLQLRVASGRNGSAERVGPWACTDGSYGCCASQFCEKNTKPGRPPGVPESADRTRLGVPQIYHLANESGVKRG